MAFKPTKTEAKTGAAYLDELEAATATLNAAIGTFNEGLSALRSDLQDVIDAYNEQLEGIREFAGDVAGRFDDEISEKSDHWHESEAAGAAAEIRDAWQSLNIEDVEMDFPEDAGFEVGDHKNGLRDLLEAQA